MRAGIGIGGRSHPCFGRVTATLRMPTAAYNDGRCLDTICSVDWPAVDYAQWSKTHGEACTMMVFQRLAAITGTLICTLSTAAAYAQQEFPPPQGQGRVVVVSGQFGPGHYETIAGEIAALGDDGVLFDSNAMIGTKGEGLRLAIQKAQQMPHAQPGKVALVGFSLGGGMSL